jgi:hypothetical protein
MSTKPSGFAYRATNSNASASVTFIEDHCILIASTSSLQELISPQENLIKIDHLAL